MKINLGDIFKNDMCHFENIPLEIQLWELKQSVTAYVCELQLENVHMLFFENITCVKNKHVTSEQKEQTWKSYHSFKTCTFQKRTTC